MNIRSKWKLAQKPSSKIRCHSCVVILITNLPTRKRAAERNIPKLSRRMFSYRDTCVNNKRAKSPSSPSTINILHHEAEAT